MSRLQVLSTKELQPEILQQVQREGMDITEQPFIAIEYSVDATMQDHLRSLQHTTQVAAFTSANAVMAVADSLQADVKWQVYSLSCKTQQALNSIGWGRYIAATADDAAALAQCIIAQGCTRVIFFCGDQRRDTLPVLLQQNGIAVEEYQVYRTIETPSAVDTSYDAVLFFSPSAVNSFFRVNQLSASVICFAIGHTTAGAIKEKVNNTVIVAAAPTQESVAQALINYYIHKPQ